ncbi:MAG: sulfatase-like hydrolase/transferase, partial [bacterium]|nr:sulfatase-like hydrolase/transferase [bacterium]
SSPNLDRIAEAGVRFTNGYASAYVCAPTRAGLLTGRYQQRFGFYTASDSRTGMPTSEITIADVLRGAGYATGVFGKWHVGLEPEYQPLERGFDSFYGFLGHGAHDYFKLGRSSPHNSIRRNREIIDDTGYLTDNLAREAVAFIHQHRQRPFFLYLPFNAVHWPLQAPEADVKRFSTGNENRDIYLAMLHRMDLATGAVLDALDKLGLTGNTLVIFFSDNGGAQKNHANNGVLRDFKQSVYEGGLRVPFLVSWPARLPRGVTNDEPVISLDVFPTICAAAGAPLPDDRIYDGKDLLPLLTGETKGPVHDALFWDGDDRKQAARAGKWKLVKNRGATELYNLEDDPGESKNLYDHHPDILKRLETLFTKWRSQMAPRLERKRP